MMKTHLRSIQRNAIGACLYTLFLLLFSNSVTAQTTSIDSLEHWVKTYPRKDTVYIKNLIDLEKLYYTQKPEKIGTYANAIIENSKKLNFSYGIEKGLATLAYQNIQKGKYQEAIKVIYEKLKYDEQVKNTYEKANSHSILAYIYNLTGKNKEVSLNHYLQAKELIESLPPSNRIKNGALIAVYSNLSMMYGGLGEYDKVNDMLFVALRILEKDGESKNSNFYYQKAALLLNIGDNFSNLKKHKESINYINKGLEIAKKYDIGISLPRFYAALCNNYIKLKQYNLAYQEILPLKKMYESNLLSVEETSLYLDYLEQIMLNTKQFKDAYFVSKSYQNHLDSIKGTEQQNKIRELTIKYGTEQKEAKIKQLQQEKVFSQTQRNYVLAVAVLLAVLLIGAIISVIQIRKAKLRVELSESLRNKLFALVTHDLRSPVASLRQITTKVGFVLSKNDPTATTLLTSSIEEAANSLYGLVDNLLHWTLLQQGKVKFTPTTFVLQYEIEEVIQTLRYRSKAKEQWVLFDKGEDSVVTTDRMFLQTIVRNLLDNAIKFTKVGKKIQISIVKDEQYTEIQVIDEGEGIAIETQSNLFNGYDGIPSEGTDGEKGKGVGLNLCYELAQLANCQLYISETSSSGTTMAFRIPTN